MLNEIVRTFATVATAAITCWGYNKLTEIKIVGELHHEIEKATDELCHFKYEENSKEFKEAKAYQKEQEIKRKNKVIESSLTFQILKKLGYNVV
jgi:hypothetical protein